ncbi:hypothetical protein D9615_008886 [Tricholomella constricta]|uniref:Uncharacterized protein n=1 Tax=Tricholomella constricta TaxID=117010 RepID=A0A8H5LYK1_9AGAR|nr:hypothetical protein D9615_008886 [Tricholomella constricta]
MTLNPNSNVPLQTLIAALAHHLALDLSTTTPLAAAAVSSPFFLVYPPTNERLQGLVTAFRHAVQLKHQALVTDAEEGWSLSKAIFSKGVEGGIREWVREVIKGLQGGRAVIRLACSVGLLLGLSGLHKIYANNEKVENEVIIALAEVMDDYSVETGDWEKEFRPQLDETLLSLTLILASQSLPLISERKLKALPLSLLANFLTSTISTAFQQGNFLSNVPESTASELFHVPPDSSFAQTVQRMSTSPTMLAMAGLSKLTATVLAVLLGSSAGGLQDSHDTLATVCDITRRIEQDWRGTKLARIEREEEIYTRDLSKATWLLLKTFLFSTVMIADGVLGAIVYVRPPQASTGTQVTPQTLAQSTLQTLSHISFVVSQFGGVTATATSDDPGFTELRKVFYLALDILTFSENSTKITPGNSCETFVKELVADLGVDVFVPENIKSSSGVFEQAKTAYTLACIEQLVPLLGVPCLKEHVWGLCVPYLSDPSHRETFESAHSVVLSIFASHAQQQQPGHQIGLGLPAVHNRRQIAPEAQHESRHPNEVTAHGTSASTETSVLDSTGFVHRMVPYYAQCLIENSQDGRLSTAQLRLAYAALVRSACSFNSTASTGSHQLGWYCISLILDMIRELSQPELEESARERVQRLHLTLISTVPSLPLPLMIRALEEIRSIITTRSQSDSGVGGVGDGVEEERRRKELVDALFTEILERVGDREKEAAIRWWYAHRNSFLWGGGDDDAITKAEEKAEDILTTDQSPSDAVSRL